MSDGQQASSGPDASQEEVSAAALAWAEYLYDEYVLAKHKQLLLANQNTTIPRHVNKGKS